MDVREIQTRLDMLGFNPGKIDGIWGRRTIQAVRAFQAASGLTPDGIVGPLTLRALTGTAAHAPIGADIRPEGLLTWYDEATRLVGTREDMSERSSPTILTWARDLNIDYRSDDVPWCGLFVAHCIGATLPDEQLPNSPLWARGWLKFGERSDPKRGAVLVFWRGSQTASTGHVGFYHSEDSTAYHVLGGNQSNAVNVARIAKSRLLDARWPRTAATVTGPVVMAAPDGPLSHEEA